MTINHATRAIAIGALLALGAAGCSSMHPNSYAGTKQERTATQTVSDAAITAKVKTEFAADRVVKARHIDVDTLRGVVTLNGTVNSDAERDQAISIARNTKGVVQVKDNLRVAG